jgi:hypothetical protein
MATFYISLFVIFAAFGAFCFNIGNSRAYKLVLKALLKGQADFIDQRVEWLDQNQDAITQAEFTRTYVGYETIGRLVVGWYRYFASVRDDAELKALKIRMKESLERYLATLERIAAEKSFSVEA